MAVFQGQNQMALTSGFIVCIVERYMGAVVTICSIECVGSPYMRGQTSCYDTIFVLQHLWPLGSMHFMGVLSQIESSERIDFAGFFQTNGAK